MPQASTVLPVHGRTHHAESRPLFVLGDRLTGHDTFLTGVLELDGKRIRVRIVTLDDLTVLQPVAGQVVDDAPPDWAGQLHLPHGQRPRQVPADLQTAAGACGSSLATLDDADLHYALTFLAEATTPQIRAGRVRAIVAALPPLPTEKGYA